MRVAVAFVDFAPAGRCPAPHGQRRVAALSHFKLQRQHFFAAAAGKRLGERVALAVLVRMVQLGNQPEGFQIERHDASSLSWAAVL